MKFLKKYESFNKYDYIMLNPDAMNMDIVIIQKIILDKLLILMKKKCILI